VQFTKALEDEHGLLGHLV